LIITLGLVVIILRNEI